MPNNAAHNALSAAVNRAIADGAPVYVNVPPPVAPRYHFRRVCSYMGTIEYEISDETGRYRAELRTCLSDYERSTLNYRPEEIAPEIENTIGMLRRCVCDNRGEIDAATLAAFNAWRAAEHESWLSRMRAEPDRYGTDFSDFPPPVPAFAGFWEKGKGWTRVWSQAELAQGMIAADAAWTSAYQAICPRKVWPGDFRYTDAAKGAPGSELRALHDAFIAASKAWHEALQGHCRPAA